MTDTAIIAAMGAILFALIGVVWSNLRGEITEVKARVRALETENARLITEHARSEERDKAFEKGIDRLTKAIDEFDSRIGAQIENLSRIVAGAQRSMSPSPRKYAMPIKREDDK